MKCPEIEAQFSLHLEDELDGPQARQFEQHLASCEACKRSFESFRYALGDLQELQVRESDSREIAAILAAVEQSTSKPVTPWRRVATHLLAAGIGGLVIWFLLPRETIREEVLVDRLVEVPVETRVEVPVEVPVEVRIEVPVEVERFVEVPVERVREVAHPLQGDANRLLALADAIHELAVLAAVELPVVVAEEDAPESPEIQAERENSRSPVRVVRSGESVSLRTRGPESQVVPVLIAMLSDEDPRLRRVVEERLESIRGVPGVPGAAEGAPKVTRKPVGLADLRELIHGSSVSESEPDPDRTATLWRTWWIEHSSALAAVDARPTY